MILVLAACAVGAGPVGKGKGEAVYHLADAPLRWTGTAAEGAGSAFAGGDLDGDGVVDLVVGARNASHVRIFRGPLTGGTTADWDAEIAGERGADLGWSVAFVGDVNSDGLDDLGLGAPREGVGGEAWIFAGSDGDLETPYSVFIGTATSQAGVRVGPTGDQDQDGVNDWLVGAWLDPVGGEQGGAIYILPGGGGTLTPEDAIARRYGGDHTWAGYGASCAGDVDGDGIFDLVAGADGSDIAGDDAGAAFVERGPILGDRALAGALTGEAAGDFAGHSAIIAGDLFGTGRDTVVIGGFGAGDDRRDGAAYVYADIPESGALADADIRVSGQPRDSIFGYALASPGDVNGDGFADIVVTAPFDNGGGDTAGAAWLVYGPPEASLDLSSNAAVFLGESAYDQAGYNAGNLGDYDGDGRADLVFGAMANDAGGTDAGAVYVWPGG